MNRSCLLICCALLSLGSALATTARASEVTLAAAGPVTGPYAVFGEQLQKGAEMAIADINKSGGLLGNTIKLKMMDDACDPKQAVAVANDIAAVGIPFVVGHYCSGSSIPASQVYRDEGIIEISPGSTNPDYTDHGGPTIFRVCGRDDQQGKVLGTYIAQHFAGKKIAVLQDKTAYGKGLADQTVAALDAAGIKPVLYEAYTAGEKDYSAIVARVKDAGADVLFVGGYHTEAGLILRQLREQGSTAQLIGGDALLTTEFWSITGAAGNGAMMTFGPDPRNHPEAAAVVNEFRKAGYEPEGYTLYTYAAVQAYAEAVKKAGSFKSDDVAKALHGGTFDTVMGTLSFDTKGDVKAPTYVMYSWQNGKFAEIGH